MAASRDALDLLDLFEIELYRHHPLAAMLLMLPEESDTTYDPTKPKFSMDSLTDAQCLEYFRFKKADITRLTNLLHFPEHFVLANRCIISGLDALCIFLYHLAYPSRLVQLEYFLVALKLLYQWL